MSNLVLKSKISKVYKNKKLNNANFGDFNHNDYQVFLYLVSKIGGIDEYGKYLQSEQLKREYVLTANEFNKVFNTDLSYCYKIIHKACKKLMKTSVNVEKPETSEIWEINVCSMAKYNKNEGSITIKFTDDIMPYLAQVKQRFMLYNLKEIANFGSLYTTRLYELIQEFKETGWFIRSVQQLRELFAVGDKLKSYADFKRKTFIHACQEVNDNYNLGLFFEEIKESRKVVAIRFSFKPIVIDKITDQKTGITRNVYKKPKLQSEKKEREPRLLKLSEVLENQLSFKKIRTK